VKRGERLDLAWDLLEQGEFDGAVGAARALVDEEPGDAEALILLGSALLESGQRDEALERLRSALRLDPDDVTARLTLASALYESSRLDEALGEVEAVLRREEADPHPHYVKGLVLDALGRRPEADACFAEATRRDPGRYPAPMMLDDEAFDEVVQQALEELPPEFRERLEAVPVVVQDVPDASLIQGLEGVTPDLLGLFVGVPLPEKSHLDLPQTPEAIYLFRRNLQRLAGDAGELAEEIRVTLLHEIGHYLGMDEQDLEAAGYA